MAWAQLKCRALAYQVLGPGFNPHTEKKEKEKQDFQKIKQRN
jgi:hypothetical protein